ncbi:MAG TPA: cold shock domain-containing protein [Ilumatobacter sp.]|jgi:CspA family cold shock protein|nr:cold shock domain-containing protein [Ilumatobacter sp.]
MRGTVSQFDDVKGLGVITTADGRAFPFHCIEIADGTRTIEAGQVVTFRPLPRFGAFQAGAIDKI